MYKLQLLYSLILNPVFLFTRRIDERVRNMIITLCCIFLAGFFIAYYDTANWDTIYLHHGRNNFICGTVLALIITCSIRKPLQKTRWDPILFWLMFSAGLGLVFVSFIHPIGDGYRSFGFLLMFEYPCLYYVWNNRGDYNTLYIRLTGATAAVGLIFYCKIAFLALSGQLVEEGFRVKANFYNANMFSMVGMAMVCSALYMFIVKRDSKRWFIFSILSFGAGWDIIRMGVSRLSLLVGIGGIFAYCVFWIKTREYFTSAKDFRIQLIRFGCIVIVTIMFFVNGEILLNINTSIQYRHNNEVSAEKGTVNAADDTEATPREATKHDITSATDRFSTEGQNLNSYSAGRIDLWRRYAQHLNMIGNNLDTTDFAVLTGKNVQHAHNNFLEYAYRCGVPVAIIHILLELYAGIICIGFLFCKKYKDPAYLFATIFMVCYAVESLFDIATLPFERHAPFFFYMALIPVFGYCSSRHVLARNH